VFAPLGGPLRQGKELQMRNFFLRGPVSRFIPLLTLSLALLLVLCFLLQQRLGATDVHPHGNTRISTLFAVSGDAIRRGHWLRLFTANLFHMNVGHLLSNLFGLMFFSSVLEIALGKSRAAIIILLSALGGTVGSLLVHMVDWMVGSSTILFGVFGGLGVLMVKYRAELHRFFVAALIGWCVVLTLLSTLGYLSLEIVDQGAHVGGIVAGGLVTLAMIYPCSLRDLDKPIGLKTKSFLALLLAIFALSFIREVFMFAPLLEKLR
jgi:rhomboid protease GluP